MRIVWLCHYFAPEIGAPQARLLEMSRVFRDEGHDVAVVTCFPNHPTGVLREEDCRFQLEDAEDLDEAQHLLEKLIKKYENTAPKLAVWAGAGPPLLQYPAWSAPVLSHGRLYLRSWKTLYAIGSGSVYARTIDLDTGGLIPLGSRPTVAPK